MTDHGSTRLTNSRARRGPRPAAEETVPRAERTASATRPAPEAGAPTGAAPIVARPAGRCGRFPVPTGRVMVGLPLGGAALAGGACSTLVMPGRTGALLPTRADAVTAGRSPRPTSFA